MKMFAMTLVLGLATLLAVSACTSCPCGGQAGEKLACCGETCKAGCCTEDSAGKVTCSMGGSCCVKVEKK